MRLEIVVADVSAAAVCTMALGLTWTRDPFDRLLAAHATAANLPLVTKDETLRQHLPLAWWAEEGGQALAVGSNHRSGLPARQEHDRLRGRGQR